MYIQKIREFTGLDKDKNRAVGQSVPNTQTVNKKNSVIHGDCINVMKRLPARSVDMILTDPPYLINYKSRDNRRVPNDNNADWLEPAFIEMYRVLKPDRFCINFYGYSNAEKFIHAYQSAGFRIVGHLVFPKRYTSSAKGFVRSQHECAHILAKGYPVEPEEKIGDVIEWCYSGNKLHPTQKPVASLLPLIETFSHPQGLVLDPFAGSGSSLLAAKMLGRSYFGIEIDRNYHAIATERLQSSNY
jgi:site-specific DNA-methyltransferase (adenine-specific)